MTPRDAINYSLQANNWRVSEEERRARTTVLAALGRRAPKDRQETGPDLPEGGNFWSRL